MLAALLLACAFAAPSSVPFDCGPPFSSFAVPWYALGMQMLCIIPSILTRRPCMARANQACIAACHMASCLIIHQVDPLQEFAPFAISAAPSGSSFITLRHGSSCMGSRIQYRACPVRHHSAVPSSLSYHLPHALSFFMGSAWVPAHSSCPVCHHAYGIQCRAAHGFQIQCRAVADSIRVYSTRHHALWASDPRLLLRCCLLACAGAAASSVVSSSCARVSSRSTQGSSVQIHLVLAGCMAA
jgi:hypothetical protein